MSEVTTLSRPETIPAMLHPVKRLLHDPEVVEISLNPDGNLFVERFGSEAVIERKCGSGDAESMIRWCASGQDRIIDRTSPIVSVMVPGFAHRIEALLPPVVMAPVFSIRRHHESPIDLEMFDWGTDEPGEISRLSAIIKCIVGGRKNMVVCGATGSGKTSFANACLRVIACVRPRERVVIIEDTPELRSELLNTVSLRTSDTVDQQRLLVSTLRLAPDRIIVGECRDGAAALTMLRAWNTGHRGGITTLHANAAGEVVSRLDMLCSEVAATSQEKLIRSTIDVVVYLERGAGRPVVREILEVKS